MIFLTVFVRIFFLVLFSSLAIKSFVLTLDNDNTLLTFVLGCLLCSASLFSIIFFVVLNMKVS